MTRGLKVFGVMPEVVAGAVAPIDPMTRGLKVLFAPLLGFLGPRCTN